MAIYKRGKLYWYKFVWHGKVVRESTKQGSNKVAREMEAAHRTSLAKGEVGLREKKTAPTLGDFAQKQFLPWAESTFSAKPKTWLYYRNGVRRLCAFQSLTLLRLDDTRIAERIPAYIADRQSKALLVSTI